MVLHGTSATLDDSAKDARENVYDALHTLLARGDSSPAASVCVARASQRRAFIWDSTERLMLASVS